MGELGALFNPGMRHEIEERQSKASRREEEGQADPGNLRIDLLSGVAVINMRGKADEQHPEEDDVTEQDRADDSGENPPTTDDTAAGDEARSDEAVQSPEPDSAEVDRSATADTGSAPRLPAGTSVSADGDVDQAALDIARSTANTEPPA